MDFLLQNKEWVFSGIGVAIVTLAITLAPSIFQWLKQIRRGTSRFAGTYEAYICRIRNDGTFLRSAVQIASSLRGFRVIFNSYRYRYRGQIRLFGHNIFIEMRGPNHEGYMYCVFKEPLGDFDVLVGVFAAITSTRLPVAGRILMRRTSRAFEDVMPAFLNANDLSAGIACNVKAMVDNLIIVPDLPVFQYEELVKEVHNGNSTGD